MMEMMQAGVVTNARKRHHRGKSVACRCFGSEKLYRYVDENPQVELFLLLGADMLYDLPSWREAGAICELAIPAVVRRWGIEEPDFDCLAGVTSPERIEEIRRHQVEMPEIGLSSTDIRRRVSTGQSIRFHTPRAVERYIQTHRLYQ